MANPGVFKTFTVHARSGVSVTIKPYKLVTHGDKNTVKTAGSPEKPIIGATQELGGANGRVDVCVSGRPMVEAGATIEAGDPLTTNAAGEAIKAEPGKGKDFHVIGFALEAAADGEWVTYEHSRFVLKGAPASEASD